MELRPPSAPDPGSRWRVAVVDDHSIIRAIFKSLVDDDPGLELIWSASCLAEARRMLASARPDLLIVDVSLPDGNGLDLAREALILQPHLRILVVSSHAGAANARLALKSGARGYVAKSSAPENISEAIDAIRTGGTYFKY